MTHDNSPAKCMNKCSENNFKYAGVQYNYQCWCGNSYNMVILVLLLIVT